MVDRRCNEKNRCSVTRSKQPHSFLVSHLVKSHHCQFTVARMPCHIGNSRLETIRHIGNLQSNFPSTASDSASGTRHRDTHSLPPLKSTMFVLAMIRQVTKSLWDSQPWITHLLIKSCALNDLLHCLEIRMQTRLRSMTKTQTITKVFQKASRLIAGSIKTTSIKAILSISGPKQTTC